MTERNDWMERANQELEMDAALERTQAIQGLIRDSQQEDVSLQWRSQLNEKLLAAATPVKAKKHWRFGRPMMAGALACSVLLAGFWFNSSSKVLTNPTPSIAAQTVEDQMIQAHLGLEFAANNTTTSGSEPVGQATESPGYEWGAEDLGTL